MNTLNSLHDHLVSGQFLESKIFYTILAIVIFWLIKKLVMAVMLRDRDVQIQYRIRKTVAYITYPLAFLVIGRIWFAGIQAVSTYLGLLSAGLRLPCRSPWSTWPGGRSSSGDSRSRSATASNLAPIAETSSTRGSSCSA